MLFDQRGCGKSTPHAALEDNTTWHLVADMERLREHLGIERWQVFGGSWGSTLALAYAETHPRARHRARAARHLPAAHAARSTGSTSDGASALFPDAWEHYLAPIPEAERGDLLARLPPAADRRRRRCDQLAAARAWSVWEGARATLRPNAEHMQRNAAATSSRSRFARIECHYFVNRGFFDDEDQLLRDVARIRHIPAVIVQGRYDVVCPMESAWELHRAWPEAELASCPTPATPRIEPGITVHELVAATDRFLRLGARP